MNRLGDSWFQYTTVSSYLWYGRYGNVSCDSSFIQKNLINFKLN